MSFSPYSTQAGLADFDQQRFRAALQDVLAFLTRRSDALLSYEEVARQLRLSARSERGIQTIPIASIVGSVGRTNDFTRDFRPRRGGDRERWARVRNAFLDPSGKPLPPIQVYQVGQVYFVLDGNHRVSVARSQGVTYIEAEVIEIQTPVELTPDLKPGDLICHAELADFLIETGLGDPAYDFDFSVNECGQYPKLREQVAVHQLILSRTQHREVPFTEAAADWVATVYAPVVRIVRDRELLRWFPDYTETDLYLWVTDHQHQLRADLGWDVRPDAAVTDFVVRASREARRDESAPGTWSQQRLADRYLDHLFMDVLIPLHDSPASWNALDQALLLAGRENARLHALHVTRGQADPAALQALEARFTERCAAAGVSGDFAVETGEVAHKISERALLTDLVVLNVSHPPSGGLSALTSGWRALLKNATRPILAVPQTLSTLERALLIFDGSDKARQALFCAAYFGEMWHTALTVLIVDQGTSATADAETYARAYLELHEVTADYITAPATADTFLESLAARNLDLLLLAADSASPWQQIRGKSIVSALLRESNRPILISQ